MICNCTFAQALRQYFIVKDKGKRKNKTEGLSLIKLTWIHTKGSSWSVSLSSFSLPGLPCISIVTILSAGASGPLSPEEGKQIHSIECLTHPLQRVLLTYAKTWTLNRT